MQKKCKQILKYFLQKQFEWLIPAHLQTGLNKYPQAVSENGGWYSFIHSQRPAPRTLTTVPPLHPSFPARLGPPVPALRGWRGGAGEPRRRRQLPGDWDAAAPPAPPSRPGAARPWAGELYGLEAAPLNIQVTPWCPLFIFSFPSEWA